MVVGETPSAMHGTNRTNPPPAATATIVEETPSAMHGTNRYNLPPVERSQLFNRTRVLEAEAEVVSLRSDLISCSSFWKRIKRCIRLISEHNCTCVTLTNAHMHGPLRLLATSVQCTSPNVIHHALLSYQQEQSVHPSALRDIKEEPGASQGGLCASDDPIDDCSDSRHVVIVNADSYSTHYTSIIHWWLSYL